MKPTSSSPARWPWSRSPAAIPSRAMPRPTRRSTSSRSPPPKGGDWTTIVSADRRRRLHDGQSQRQGEADRIWLADLPALPRVRREGRAAADQQICEDRPGQLGIPQLCPRRLRPYRVADRALQRRQELLPAVRAHSTRTSRTGSARSRRLPPAQLEQLQNLPPQPAIRRDGQARRLPALGGRARRSGGQEHAVPDRTKMRSTSWSR